MSVIVSDANVGARRLYERFGYQEAGRRLIVKEQWSNLAPNRCCLLKSCKELAEKLIAVPDTKMPPAMVSAAIGLTRASIISFGYTLSLRFN